ncbi:MAG: SpoIIE family protein phosphatase [Gammaproteobacteria bacterium]
MSIRRKLVLLLGFIAVLPAILTIVLDVDVIRSLSRDLTARSAAILAEQAQRTMSRIASEYADVLDRESRRVRLLVELQADAATRALAAPAAAHAGITPYFDEAFEAALPELDLVTTPAPRVARERHTAPPLAVSWQHASLHVVAGLERGPLLEQARALASLGGFFRLVRDPQDTLLGWQYVALDNGLSASYPGHGDNPPDFDPRTRPWFEDQLRQPGFRWYRPHHDASTAALLINAAAPVRDGDGRVIGVTGIDVDLSSTFALLELPPHLRPGSTVMAVAVVGAPLFDPPRAIVLARQSAAAEGDWQTLPRLADFALDDAAATANIRAAMVAGADGEVQARVHGEDSFVLYRHFGDAPGYASYVVMSVPVAAATAEAMAAARDAAGTTRAHLRGLLVLVLAVTVVAALLAFALAHHFTRPIGELLTATERLARGDFDARARIVSRDEIGTLGRAFNDMVPRLKDHARVEEALALAHEVQQQLLPKAPPAVAGYDIAGVTLYSEQTGGDFFDYLDLATPCGRGRAVVVADVSGHGVGPGLLMATTRALLRGARDRALAPGDLLAQVNRDLVDDVSRGHFVTLFLLVLDAGGEGALQWASAGHDPAMVWKAATRAMTALGADDIPLGIDADWSYASHDGHVLGRGDIVVLGTDGVWDTRRDDGERYGKARLEAYVAAHAERSAADLCRGLERELAAFRGRATQVDDLTLVVIRRTAD